MGPQRLQSRAHTRPNRSSFPVCSPRVHTGPSPSTAPWPPLHPAQLCLLEVRRARPSRGKMPPTPPGMHRWECLGGWAGTRQGVGLATAQLFPRMAALAPSPAPSTPNLPACRNFSPPASQAPGCPHCAQGWAAGCTEPIFPSPSAQRDCKGYCAILPHPSNQLLPLNPLRRGRQRRHDAPHARRRAGGAGRRRVRARRPRLLRLPHCWPDRRQEPRLRAR